MAYYFIGGLGCNVYYPQDFLTALELPIVYLDLYCQEIRQEADLEEWFVLQVDLTQEMTLIAHSLGADFAVYLASVFPSVKKLILLDHHQAAYFAHRPFPYGHRRPTEFAQTCRRPS